MRCPFCNSTKTRVVDKRTTEEFANKRRRECLSCGKRFSTFERIEIEKTKNKVPYVQKRDGKLVELLYSRQQNLLAEKTKQLRSSSQTRL